MYQCTENVHERLISILLLCVLSTFVPDPVFSEMFRSECQDRHFSLSVKSSFLGQVFRFDIEDGSGMHSLTSQQAAECGYSMVLDSQGDLVLRVSYLACYVDLHKDMEFRLLVWFVNKNANDEETSYPLALTCPLQQHWSPREIVCEEDYMEVSVEKQILPDSQMGLEGMTSSSTGSEEEGLKEGRVLFRMPGHAQGEGDLPSREKALTVAEANLQGYHISATENRILLRCAYSSVLSYTLQERGDEVEAVSATIFYSHLWTLHTVDISVACPINQAVMDDGHVLWTFPKILPPLVHAGYSAWSASVGVEGHLLSDCVIQRRGYEIRLRDGIVEIRIPFGAEGGYVKSHVVDGQYFQSYSIDLLYMHQWEDSRWVLTQHRSFRPLWTPPIPWTPMLLNNTVPSERVFSVTLGAFAPDVSLHNITVGGETVSWVKAERLGLKVSLMSFPNGTHAYQLEAPFSHPLISKKYVGGRYRRYMLAVTFTLLISPHGDIYNHPAAVACDLQDVVFPRLEGNCTNRGVQILVHHGNLDSQWAVYLGGHKLDWELVEQGGYVLETRKDYYSLELPLYSIGMVYEDLTLRGLVVSVQVNLMDRETGSVESTFVQRCCFPIRELLVCLPDRWMVLVVDTSHITLPVEPRHTTLLDPSCGPRETDHTRVLFSFPLDSCGTIRTLEGNHVVYVNEVRYSPALYPTGNPLIHPHYRLPVSCRYPVNDERSRAVYHLRPAVSVAPSSHRRTVRSRREGSQRRPASRGEGQERSTRRPDLQKRRPPVLGGDHGDTRRSRLRPSWALAPPRLTSAILRRIINLPQFTNVHVCAFSVCP
ncbi:uncharacterized protein LOC118236141 isoform X1 [Anguilla anguilla]|uniref:uncharacterized protein LOC118236141 isoform X1 n=1 Tax=Anguilla anguilla TaxID=7936 RepID=UPI0015B2B565|nr:uncharacterized protein LOC118236141 isoform X1 [Anguilla anguilla]